MMSTSIKGFINDDSLEKQELFSRKRFLFILYIIPKH